MIDAIHRKLLRDLALLRGQVITITLVIACGIASFVTLAGTYGSLQRARDRFYDRQRFADVFVTLERAPETLRAELAIIPGVARVQARIVEPAMLPLANVPEPIRARIVSLPDAELEVLNAIRMRDGRRPEPGNSDEALLLAAFADAHGIRAGDRLPGVINGKRRELSIVGIVTSPEYVVGVSEGTIVPDPKRFGLLWMSSAALAPAFAMEGAFNEVSIAVQPGASVPEVIIALDRALAPYGGTGARTRAWQQSNRMVESELSQLETMSTVMPMIFLAVAALLVNMVLSRLVLLQRPEIATLKAVGYSNARVAAHFLELVGVVAGLGSILGLALGVWTGGLMVDLYAGFFKFPDLAFELDVRSAVIAVLASWIAAAAGALASVSRVARMPPAEAMRAPAPARYVRSVIDRIGLGRRAGPILQMIARELQRRPVRTLFSAVAIAAATGLTIVGGWYYAGTDAFMSMQFEEVMREDMAVTFIEAKSERAVRELSHLPGVIAAEGVRVVPVRFRAGHRLRDGALWGYPTENELRKLRDRWGRPVALPPDGVVLTDVLAELLGVSVGDRVELEVLEGGRGRYQVVVAGVVDEAVGLQGHMEIDALHRLLREERHVSQVLLRVDPELERELEARLKDMPSVASATRRATLRAQFREQMGSTILVMAAFISLFAATITIGVVYNNARVALATRARELATLRVLGFTRGEISSVLLGELAIQVLIALPCGLLFGRWLVFGVASTVDPETYRLPVILPPAIYAFAAVVTLVASIASAFLVRRRLDRLDLIGVLKTRE